MQKFILAIAVLLALGPGSVTAQTCSTTDRLDQTAIKAALVDKWACAKDGVDMWNERLTGSGNSGPFKECHSGLSTGPDPIDNNKGTWSTNNNPGTITYAYGGSFTYTYYVYGTASPYTFCRVSDAKIYAVHITSCPPPTLNTCP